MEIALLLNTVLGSISCLGLLSSSPAVKVEPVRRFYQNVNDVLKLFSPFIGDIINLEGLSSELLYKPLNEVNTIINEAIDHVEAWHQMSSKVCFVLQTESLVIRLNEYVLEIFKMLDSMSEIPFEPEIFSHIKFQEERLEQFFSEEISDILKKCIRDHAENNPPNPRNVKKIIDLLQLQKNQDLLLESVALEDIKLKAEIGENKWDPGYVDHMIGFIMFIHERMIKAKHSLTMNGVNLPSDFYCPLSLELMSDPVIVASGQTYERAFIEKWLDSGISVCPKTRQKLSRNNLIPNYTVKALIANWCKSTNIKLPDSINYPALEKPSVLSNVNGMPSDSPNHPQLHRLRSPHANGSRNLSPLDGAGSRHRSLSMSHVSSTSCAKKGLEGGIEGTSLADLAQGRFTEELNMRHARKFSVSSSISNKHANEPFQVYGKLTHYSSDVSSELVSGNLSGPHADRESSLQPAPKNPSYIGQSIGRTLAERPVPQNVSSSSLESSPVHVEIESQVCALVENLQSIDVGVQREATEQLRLLAKHSMDNRLVIAKCGAISHLVNLLHSSDLKTQEIAVTALLNLSINDNNKISIANAGAIEPLIHVLEFGNSEARENSAATLFSLSVLEENKFKIGRSGGIKPLVELLGTGSPRGKKDAATALFNLSILHENKSRIVKAGAVKLLIELTDPAAGMVDKAVAVLANLAIITEGRTAIGQLGGIPILVEVVELGSSRGKENAAAALLQICSHSNRFCNMVLREGAVPPLVNLSQSGTPRAREKAQSLLKLFKAQRHNSAARG